MAGCTWIKNQAIRLVRIVWAGFLYVKIFCLAQEFPPPGKLVALHTRPGILGKGCEPIPYVHGRPCELQGPASLASLSC